MSGRGRQPSIQHQPQTQHIARRARLTPKASKSISIRGAKLPELYNFRYIKSISIGGAKFPELYIFRMEIENPSPIRVPNAKICAIMPKFALLCAQFGAYFGNIGAVPNRNRHCCNVNMLLLCFQFPPKSFPRLSLHLNCSGALKVDG
jgi:hypothetical protein